LLWQALRERCLLLTDVHNFSDPPGSVNGHRASGLSP